MARFHLRQHADHLHQVPARAQVVGLGDCGSHCRGARFYDAGPLLTPALERAIDDIAARFDGFYFGRFDLRVPSRGALMRGESIAILELNGVTSEVTHIYDPGVSLIEAYRALFAQWRLAFEIGAENAARGARVWSVAELAGLDEPGQTHSKPPHQRTQERHPLLQAHSCQPRWVPSRIGGHLAAGLLVQAHPHR